MIEGVSTTPRNNYTKGNANFEIKFRKYSLITKLGKFDLVKDSKPIKTTFKEIKNRMGYISMFKLIYICL